MNRPEAPRQRRDFAPALWGVQMFVAAVASFFIWLQRMGIAGCANDCDFTLLALAGDGFFFLAILLVVATGVLLLVLPSRRQGHSTEAWIPTVGIALTLIAAVVASALINVAIEPPTV